MDSQAPPDLEPVTPRNNSMTGDVSFTNYSKFNINFIIKTNNFSIKEIKSLGCIWAICWWAYWCAKEPREHGSCQPCLIQINCGPDQRWGDACHTYTLNTHPVYYAFISSGWFTCLYIFLNNPLHIFKIVSPSFVHFCITVSSNSFKKNSIVLYVPLNMVKLYIFHVR